MRYVWLDELPTLNRPFLTDHVPAGGEGWAVEKLVFVQADCLPEQGLAEAEWVTALAKTDPRIQGIVAFAPLELGEGARPSLEKLAANRLVKGIRRLIQSEPPGFSIQPEFIAGVKLAAELGFSFDLCIRHYQLPDILELARRCPEVSFVLDHVGKPDIKAGRLDPWRQRIAALAGFPNVRCKISGLLAEADHERWTPADLQPYIEHVIAQFGSERVMFGSDAPVLYLVREGTYANWVNMLLEAVKGLSEGDKHRLFYENARSFYRL